MSWSLYRPRRNILIQRFFRTNCSSEVRSRLHLGMVLQKMTISAPSLRDPNTQSNYDTYVTKHTTANFGINFAERKLEGSVILDLQKISKDSAHQILLDTSHLEITAVRVARREVANWEVADHDGIYGSLLKIVLSKSFDCGDVAKVTIDLKTTDKCTALQWLTPRQTSNKKHPYMFSQCQAIHARSLFPCQDTPDVKSTYDFNIRSPLPVIASGLSTGAKDYLPGEGGSQGSLLYTFKQCVPIPSYLFAIASGDIAVASIGPRSSVATGPEEIQEAKWELEKDTESFIEVAEKLIYPYAWTTYNVLVLPPSFPYGGMENPVFTFATPTIISGDRENIDVIAHELSHSWSGNLVSNASWEHFWLNEGWTTYLERRIQAALHGEAHRDFSAIIGWKALTDSIHEYGENHEFTKLVIDLKGKDPDDAFSSVPYEKGSTFLYYLEKLLGRGKWDKFIPHYFTKYKERSVDSFEFKATLITFFDSDPVASKALEKLDWDTWFYKPGFPPKPDFETSSVDVCYTLADKWEAIASSGFKPSLKDIEDWTGNQVVVFLERVQLFKTPLKKSDVETMGKTYKFTSSKNVEIVSRYYDIGLRARDERVYQPTADLLGTVGRMKFVRPLFRLLNQVDRNLAVSTFEKNKDFYHPICRAMVEKDLFGEER